MPKEKVFEVEVSGSIQVTAKDLWPDGPPAEPTAADAAQAIREFTSRPSQVCLELGIPLTITVDGEKVMEDPWNE